MAHNYNAPKKVWLMPQSLQLYEQDDMIYWLDLGCNDRGLPVTLQL
jgi:hypothetical protein